MKMMSLSQFRNNLFKAFDLMKDANATFEVYHRRKVYRLHIQETGDKITTPYKRKRTSLPSALISSRPCSECEGLLVNGICSNSACINA